MTNLEQMRLSYTLGGLQESDMEANPMVQFQKWIEDALAADLPEWFEVNAMTLSTADLNGHVTSRIVLLKGLQNDRFWFYTNYESEKASQMLANPHVSLCFHWPHLQRQIRIEGTVEKAPREQSVEYFHSRPRDSQLGAVASQQSRTVPDRETLESALAQTAQQYENTEIPCPENWGGYGVHPMQIEFWQGRTSRLHDRLQYVRDDNQWTIRRRSP